MELNLDKAEQYRREAENCLDRAEIAPDALMRKRMKKLAAQWLKKAAKAALKKQPVESYPFRQMSKCT
jgi:hypothetical protein